MMSNRDNDLIDLREIAPAEVGEIDLYQRRERIYTRKVEGFFQKVRLYTGWPLLLGYFLLPWQSWNGQQSVLFDLPERKFHILGLTFWPQDFPMLAFLLIISAYTLFTVTTFAGRIWCGYSCPQTVWTTMFMWVEQATEGSRNQRIKLDRAAISLEKLRKKCLKHAGWLVIAFMTGLTFVGYFYGIQDLLRDLLTLKATDWGLFWVTFFTVATYINAGYMREQVCKYMCPYARFQAVMFDQDTLIVSYDNNRGDPRGSRKKTADPRELGLGSCIDCELCVQVCPTGIDIRDGLQYECIGCALCIDACDSVMDKMKYPRGLVRYTSEHELSGGRTHWLRPRIIGYAVMLCLMIGVFSYTMYSRIPLELTVIRDRNQLYVTTDTGAVDNIYTLQLVNMDHDSHVFRISLEGLGQARIIGEIEHKLNGGEVRSISLRLRANPNELDKPSTEFDFKAQATDMDSLNIVHESRFVKPL